MGDGLAIKTPLARLKNVTVASCTGRGIVVGTGWSWFFRMDDVRAVKNGSYGFYSDRVQTLVAVNCQFDGNGAHGCYLPNGTSEDVSFINCWFQRNQGSGFRGFAITAAFFSSHWDGNVNAGNAQAYFEGNSSVSMLGCEFHRGNLVGYAIDTSAGGSIVAFGCKFATHTYGAIKARPNDSTQNPPGFLGFLAGNYSDGALVHGSTYPSVPASAAGGLVVGAGTFVRGVAVDVAVAAASAITLDTTRSSDFVVKLAANVTATTMSNPSPGQVLTLSYAQDATGGRTYVWPTDCKFAGGAAPSDATASRITSVTFRRNDSYWIETSRAVAVG